MGIWDYVKRTARKVKEFISPKPTVSPATQQRGERVFKEAAAGKPSRPGDPFRRAAGVSEAQITAGARRTGVSRAPRPQQFDAGGQPISVAPTVQPEPTFWQRTGDWIGSTSVGEWLQDKGVLATQEQRQESALLYNTNVAEYEAKSVWEKAKFQGQSALMAAESMLMTGQLAPAIDLVTTKISSLIATKYGAKAVNLYATAPGKISPKELIKGVYKGKSNIATKTLITSYIGKIGTQLKKPRYAIAAVAAIGSWAGMIMWDEHIFGETLEGASNFVIKRAIETGNKDLMIETQLVSDEIFDVKWWEQIWRFSPVTVTFGVAQRIKLALQAKKINDWKIADEIEKMETGTTDDEIWEQRRLQKIEEEKASVDYYNKQAKLYADMERIARREQRNEDAKFWADYAAEQRRLEKKEREEVAAFWLEYWKQKSKLRADMSPSRLTFGLL